jgi:hypothetical protein
MVRIDRVSGADFGTFEIHDAAADTVLPASAQTDAQELPGVDAFLFPFEASSFALASPPDAAAGAIAFGLHVDGGNAAAPEATIASPDSSGVMTGTSGNDTFNVTTSTAGINGEGGNDVAIFEDVSNSYFDWYKITPDKDGGIDVAEVHATGQTVHATGVQSLQFNDGIYDVTNGVFSPTAPSSSSPSSSSPSSSKQIVAHSVPQAAGPHDVVGLLLQNTTKVAEAKGFVTFGEVFAKGAVKPGESLVATIDGHKVAVQMDVKSTNPDGSVRQAVLTLEAPKIAAGGSAAVMLSKVNGGAQGAAITPQKILNGGYDLKVDVALHGAGGTVVDKTIDAAQVLAAAIKSGHVETWLHGSQAGEYDVTAKIASNLSVTFDIRQDASGTTHTDVTFSRDMAYTKDVGTADYDVTILQGSHKVFAQNGIQQYAFSTWNTEVDSKGAIAPHIVYDMQYLIDTGAISSYDLTAGVASGSIASESQALSKSAHGPLGSGAITMYMPETGGRPDLGPNPTWVVDYLVSQDAKAENVMGAEANEAGSVPWHLIDINGQPVNVYTHPELWVDSRGEGALYGKDALPVQFDSARGGWTLDTAHQPDLSYLPYLLSGSQSDLENLKEQAAYVIASNNPGYRGATDDLIPDSSQVRAKAWDLRDIGNAAYALPNSDPMKKYFTTVLQHNLQSIIDTYVHGAEGKAEGQLKGWIGGDYLTGVMAPWEQDYFAIAMEQLSEQGFKKADTILKWEDNFLSGRFLNGDKGFNPNESLAYNLQVGDATTGTDYTTWQKVYVASFGDVEPGKLQGDATGSGGYGANARAGLAADISGTESVNAIEAYAWLVGQTPSITAAFASDPTWDIVPRLSDGVYLTNDKVQIAKGAKGSTLTAGNHDSMLIGGTGNDVLVGKAGVDIILAASGHDVLRGAAGNDYLFAGTGTDSLQGGSGSDYLKAGQGHDTFIYKNASESTHSNYDTISGLNFAIDRISLPGTVKAIDSTIAHGALSVGTFDAGLSKVLNAAHLHAHDAVLFTATSGTLAHQTFLVVDMNGVAGYQAGVDLVIHLEGATGTMHASDFI